MFFYKLVRGIVRLYFKLFFRFRVKGLANIPNEGAVILATNHTSNYDPPVVGCALDRQVHFLAKEEIFKVPILGKIVEKVGSFPIKRGGNDRKAIKTGLELLNSGKVLGVFPEGTRSKTGELGKGLPGAAMFALKSDAVVIPIGIVSNYKFFKTIIINVGKPISLIEYKKEKISSEDLISAMEKIMLHIQRQIAEYK